MTSCNLASDILSYRGGIAKNNLIQIFEDMDNFEDTLASCAESPYFDMQDVGPYIEKFKDKFVVLDTNIQSLNAKFDTFTLFLDQLASHDFYFSAICIQETWVNNSLQFETLHIPNYQTVFLPPTCSSHGGLVIYIHNSYQYKKLDLYTPSPVYEGLFLEIYGGGLPRKLVLANIYRPPRDKNCDLKCFLDIFTPVLSNITNNNHDCVITGDFNINLLNIETRTLYSEYIELLYSFSFVSTVSLPTRLSRRSATLIDHIFL